MYMNERYIVIDPGIIKMDDEDQATQSMLRMGKLFYMSPEQYFGNSKHATFKSDLYAVGIIALEIILGFNPLQVLMTTDNNRIAPHEELIKKNIIENMKMRTTLLWRKLIQMNKFGELYIN